MRRLRPDVLCLQEVLQHADLRNQAETLADSLGYHVQFASVDGARSTEALRQRNPHATSRAGRRVANLDPADDYASSRTCASSGVAARSTPTRRTCTTRPRAGRSARSRSATAGVRGLDPGRRASRPGGRFQRRAGSARTEIAHGAVRRAFRPCTRRPPAKRPDVQPAIRRRSRRDRSHLRRAGRRGGASSRSRARSIFRTVGPDSVWASDHFGVVGGAQVKPAQPTF